MKAHAIASVVKILKKSIATEPNNGLIVTKEKGTGEDRWEGRDKGRKKRKGALRLSCIVLGGVQEGLCNTQKTSSDSTASYYVEGQ